MLLVDLGWFFGGLALLLLGGDSLVKGVSGFAQKVGMPPFKAGLFLLAFATSLPELAVNARAVWAGHTDLAGWLDGPMAIDVTRALRLAGHGYRIWTQEIPLDITPKNRLLMGAPVG